MNTGLAAVFIVLSTLWIVSHYVNKIPLDHYASNPIKLYLIRAGIGIVPAFLLSGLLYYLLTIWIH
ncbi:hypothetical protein CYL18_14970 [Pradoshia eiseniae]|uniref:DUF1146 domain-containing protein n=1 Tax=Pradoshia eiseniae TaxID=2064768 RepID=A0A2S7MWY3_9BACI|nr:hypothetical protein [Pradoshia eiseniae]PQD94332.1 hypothetical protein CYL18_14970 [Pradoshia eiseniae]